MNNRIFILDDDMDLLKIAGKLLTESGYVVRTAADPKEGLRSLRSDPPELLLLDLRLPQTDGYQICKELKGDAKTSHVPIVFLSAQGDEADVVAGLEVGADDYIVKPFRKNELLARVRVVIRRHAAAPARRKVEVGPFAVDYAAYKAWMDGNLLTLTPKEFELLGYFLKHEGRVVTRATLSEHVWGADFTGASRTIDIHIERLRRKMGSAGTWIKGLKGVGYRFETP